MARDHRQRNGLGAHLTDLSKAFESVLHDCKIKRSWRWREVLKTFV